MWKPSRLIDRDVTLITKPKKSNTQKENLSRPVLFINVYKQNASKLLNAVYKRKIHYEVGFIPKVRGCFNIWKTVNVIFTY